MSRPPSLFLRTAFFLWCCFSLLCITPVLGENTSTPGSIDKGLFTGVLNTLTTETFGNGTSAESLITEGERLLQNGSFPEAARVFGEVLDTYPDSFEGWLGLARAQSGSGDQEQALASIDEFLFLHPDAWQGYILQGTILTSLSRYPEAVASYEKGLLLNDTDPFAWAGYGTALYGNGSYEKARDACQKSLNLLPGTPSAHYWEGRSRFRLGDKAGALKSLNMAVSADPYFIEAYLAISDLYEKSENLKNAVQIITDGIEKNPSSYELWKRKGILLEEMNRTNEAQDAYQEALRINPDDGDIRERLSAITGGFVI
ncbi:MAG TPA: tetratricopeptide repeat protein [Methanospirillum sp.]|uniref:tetratricopeptide repeat protein n=1 Tax=Methanospirillum sp. TaxID=45200 RepID=UPI002D1CAA16|nr:tetratricopeptide repeat protein [Methanospirillum sp.]HOJ97679.1 tetratricopeptide repeat protein [Methanospirillum sp.]HOL41531.1 tetratricopeptide repeat protein [Methanospirillum sp.]HPP76827.1 tetratricopeptide repeat protein [Methanospirillum sp.]